MWRKRQTMAKGKSAEGRTLAEFLPLLAGERRLLDACAKGEGARLSDSRPTTASEANRVRAAFIRFLALGGDERAPLHEHGVNLRGAWIDGPLDLRGATVHSSVFLNFCHFDSTPNLSGLQLEGSLNLSGSVMPGMLAERFSCSGNVLLRSGFVCNGAVRLKGAQIGGTLQCSEASFHHADKNALMLEGAVIAGNVFLSKGVLCEGCVCFNAARIGGNFECTDAVLNNVNGLAFSAFNLSVGGHMIFGGGLVANGAVLMSGVQVGGNFTCSDSAFNREGGVALNAERLVVGGSVMFEKGVSSKAQVRLLGARIGGSLDCTSASLSNGTVVALDVSRAEIKGNVYLRKGFSSVGQVNLLGAQIGGDLNCGGATLSNPGGIALSTERAVIGGSVFLRNGLTVDGQVRLLGSDIDGDIECGGATLNNPAGTALSAERTVIGGSVFLRSGLAVHGQVRLMGSDIDGDLDCSKASFKHDGDMAWMIERAVIGRTFFLFELTSPVNISLAGSRAANLNDDLESWGEKVNLDGFKYERVSGRGTSDFASRAAWLRKQVIRKNGKYKVLFRPQPWQHLMNVLREMGHHGEARNLAIEFEHQRRRAGQIPNRLLRAMHWLFGLLAGYGYRPWRVAGVMLALWLACGGFYWYGALQGVFAPSNPLVFNDPQYRHCRPGADQGGAVQAKPYVGNWYLCGELAAEYTAFSPLAYSLDLILPLVDLQQEHDWAPLIDTALPSWWQELGRFDLKFVTRLLLWFEILCGWLGSLLLVAVWSGLTTRDRN